MAFGGQVAAGVQLPGSGQGTVHFMFMGHLAGSPVPGRDGVGLATWTGGNGVRGPAVVTLGVGVTTTDGGDEACATGWVADGVVAPGAVGAGVAGEGLVTRRLTDGLDGLPRARATAVIPPAARTITASTTAHWGRVSRRSLVIRRLRTSLLRIVGVAGQIF
jgi:hypothetical protein